MPLLKPSKRQEESTRQIQIGREAPDFALPSSTGQPVRLSDFYGKKNVVLFFYPKDGTYGCIVESLAFRDQYELFKKAEADVVGISADSIDSHAIFAKKYELPFILLSDQKNQVRQLYGVPPTFGIIPGRVTYVIDKEGLVRHIFSSQFSPRSHIEQSLAALTAIVSKSV